MPSIFTSPEANIDRMVDVYDTAGRLRAARRRLAGLKHGKLLLAFLDHLQALGLSTSRILKYASLLCMIYKNVPFDPVRAEKGDVERVVAWINSRPYKSWTKHGLKLTIKKLVQFAKIGSCHKGAPVPPEVSWIELKVDEKDSRVRPEALLTVEDIKAMMMKAENERDRALISVLYEAALRPGELLTMTVGSVEFLEEYCLITVSGKTGLKRIPLVASYKPLLQWLEKHPCRQDINSPLWISLSNNSKQRRMSYYYLRKLLRTLARKCKITKEVWPYLLRHSCLTSLAKVFTESRLEQYAGWVQGSKMPRRYVHFSARDLEIAVLELHGLRKPKEKGDILQVIECPRCSKRNPPDASRCGFCGCVLDKRLAAEMEDKRLQGLEEILKRLEKLEQVFYFYLGGKS
ncbi:MAG: tyrosine-type recombinase/integrase [Candidatus Bathyarchaeia archaeon]